MNNARETWFPIVCAALDCEYGQLGSGGLAMTRKLNLPPLPQIWDHHDPATSRSSTACCCPSLITSSAVSARTTLRRTSPRTTLPGWLRRGTVAHGPGCSVLSRRWGFTGKKSRRPSKSAKRGRDSRVHVIDPRGSPTGFRAGRGATHLAFDGVHPSGYGQGMLGALIAVEAQKVLSRDK